jgi:hypothetical protein
MPATGTAAAVVNMSDFCHLPSEVLAAVLGVFSNGKTISTFMIVARGNKVLRSSALAQCRGALVQRFVEVSRQFSAASSSSGISDSSGTHEAVGSATTTTAWDDSHNELCEVLDIVREDIRLSDDNDDGIITKFSEWCAILDYFETQVAVSRSVGYQVPQWIVWCGRVDIPYGAIDAVLTTPFWTAGAMHYWRAKELNNLMLSHPRSQDFFFTAGVAGGDSTPYGSLFGLTPRDVQLLSIQSNDLQVSSVMRERNTIEARRHALVPRDEYFDDVAVVTFVDHSFVSWTLQQLSDVVSTDTTPTPRLGPLLIAPGRQSLCCCWDKEAGEEDWDEAMSRLGENVIRIMTSLPAALTSESTRSFDDALRERYQHLTEFTNQR